MAREHVNSQSLLLARFNPVGLKLSIPNIFTQKISSSLPSSIGSSSRYRGGSKPRILYVDDETSIARAIKYGLEKYGFIVDVYNHPKPALSSFKPGVYDLLLIDVRLPEMNGLDLCNELLRIDNKVKVCFITAYELRKEELRQKFSDLQDECIVMKPASFSTLISKINDQLHSNDQTRQSK